MTPTAPASEPLPPISPRDTIGARSVELEGVYAEVAPKSSRALRPESRAVRFDMLVLAFMSEHRGRELEDITALELAQWWAGL
jgi:hypothetical protein